MRYFSIDFLYIYSLLNVTVYLSFLLIMLMFITHRPKIIARVPMQINVLLIFFIGIRLLFPIEIHSLSIEINSFRVIPKIAEAVDFSLVAVDNQSITVLDVLLCIWISGIIICLIKYIMQYGLLHKNVLETPALENSRVDKVLHKVKEDNNFRFKINLIINKGVEYPAEFGLFKETIFINDYDYTDEELYYILFHELAHFHIKTNWIMLFVNFVSIMFWWNPIAYIFKNHTETLMEMYVDKFVIKHLTKDERIMYSKTIFKVYEIIGSGSSSDTILLNPMTGIFSRKELVNRFKLITLKHKNNIPLCFSLLIIILSLLFASGRYIIQPAYEPSEEYMNIPEFTSENSYIVEYDNIYLLYYNEELYAKADDINKLPKIKDK